MPDQTMRDRVAVALSNNWRRMHTNEALGMQRMLADAVLVALATPTPAMVEAGAEAIFDEERNASMGGVPRPDWDDLEDVGKEPYRVLARAALTAAFKEGKA